MKNLSTLFPVGPDFVSISRDLKSMGNREGELVLVYRFLGFFQRIYREGDDVNIFLPEIF